MLRTTIGGLDVWIGKFGDLYVLISGKEIHFSIEKPVTDQEIEKIKKELEEVREEVREVRRIRQNRLNGLF